MWLKSVLFGSKKTVKTVAPVKTRAILRSLIRHKRRVAYVAYLSWHKVPIVVFLIWVAMSLPHGKTPLGACIYKVINSKALPCGNHEQPAYI